MITKKFRPLFNALAAEAQKRKLKFWFVGGCVRDFYLNIPTKDIDVAVLGGPEPLVNFCVKKYGGEAEKFDAFGTWRVELKNGIKLDFVTARKEIYPRPAALPVVSPGNIEQDLFRRDFTCNAWAYGSDGKYFDPFCAKDAIDNGLVKILHEKSFQDDPTRLFRALRFAGRFDWKLEFETEQKLVDASLKEYPALLSRERLRAELIKILREKQLKRIFTLLDFYGLARFFYDGLKWVPALAKAKSVNARLGVLALSLGARGGDFLESLRLSRSDFQEISAALETAQSKLSPVKKLTRTQEEILKLFFPKLPAGALKPCFISGGELAAAGLKGKEISAARNKLRALQFAGKIKTKRSARLFLDTKLS